MTDIAIAFDNGDIQFQGHNSRYIVSLLSRHIDHHHHSTASSNNNRRLKEQIVDKLKLFINVSIFTLLL